MKRNIGFLIYILHKIRYSVHHLVIQQAVSIPECVTFIQNTSSSESWTGQKLFWLMLIVDCSHLRQMKWGFLMYVFIQNSIIHNTI